VQRYILGIHCVDVVVNHVCVSAAVLVVECKQGVIKWISQETLDKEKEKKRIAVNGSTRQMYKAFRLRKSKGQYRAYRRRIASGV